MSKTSFSESLANVSFKLFGGKLPQFSTFQQSYQKSGIHMFYQSYYSLMLFSCTLSFAVTFGVGMLLHMFLLRVPLLTSIVATSCLSLVAAAIIAAAFMALPLYRVRQRKNHLDSNLIYTVGYMSVLAAGGVPVERIFTRISEVEPRPVIKSLATRFVANVKLFGLDVAASLEDLTMHSPSDTFSKLLKGISNTTKTSGDLQSLLHFETKRLLALKREQLKKTLSALVALSELYVTAMVMAPITFIIMLTILSVLGSAQFGLSPAMQLNLVVFFGLPVICIIFIVLLDGILPSED
ncbi:MAG: type II secretion system F family protein [Candidatus Bathyarchaeota archaeon]|nr:type II secretion system F family protein [Candidatus Bathyarchaeota archaeon]